MTSPLEGVPQIFLQPGEIHVTREPEAVTTILGSCVALTMFHLQTRWAAICHALLPKGPCTAACTDGCDQGWKYMDCSLRGMLRFYQRREIPLKQVQIKIFGGGDVLDGGEALGDNTVGQKNLRMAFSMLDELRLFPVAQATGGFQGRKIVFLTHMGDVFVKPVSRLQPGRQGR